MIKTRLLITIFTIYAYLSCIQYIQAASPTPSPEQKSSTDVVEELKKRVLNEQIKGVIQGIFSSKKGYIGEVQRVTDEAITVKSSDSTNIISITENITLSKSDKPISVDDVAVGNWAIVIGNQSDTDFVTESVAITTEKLTPEPQVISMGSIKDITRTTIIVTSRLNEERTFTINRNTKYQNNDGTTIQLAKLKDEMQVLIVGIETEDGIELKTLRSLAPIE